MKNMKKLFGVILAVMMMVVMTVTASATTITITGGGTGSVYSAYKILNVTDGGDGKFAYTLNEKYTAALQTVTAKTTEADIVKYISELNTAASVRTFADAMYAQIKTLEADATSTNNVFADVPQGYYLIAETTVGADGDTVSLVMLDTAGQSNINIATKEDVPEFQKKIKEKNDSTGYESVWIDGADYDIGDDIPFQLTGTLPTNYASYDTYYYAFHDKACAGLTFKPESVVVKVNDTAVDASKYEVVTEGLTDGCSFEVRFANLKTVTTNAADVIYVEYKATLNSNAVLGSTGNPNEARLEYSSNPYGEGKKFTPWDKVIAFTFKINADKVDGTGNPLAGAGFTLYKYMKVSESYVAVGAEIKGTTESPKTSFTWSGLDAGKYKLVETTVPDGYNKAEDIEFTVEATYDTESANPGFGTLVVKNNEGVVISDGENAVFSTVLTDGSVNTTVENLSGTELPETGGMGTKIFYVLGSVLMLGAAVLLITKRRMNADK